MADMKRGVLVDAAGYFVGAFQWPASEPDPDFNRVVAGNSPLKPTARLYLLTSPEALAVSNPSGRWRFKEQVWEYPTERRWVVRQRRDKPDLWSLTGSKMIWPERPPRLPDGVKLIDVPPPDLPQSRKPVWDDTLGDWRAPRRIAILAQDGTVQNFVTAYRDDDLPPTASGWADAEAMITGTDETGADVPVAVGDQIAVDGGGAITATVRRLPPYKRVPVRLLEQVLTDRNLAGAFVQFVQAQGYTIEQVRALRTISLRNRLLRQFVQDQGFTMAQAYTALQRAAEILERQEGAALDQVGAEE